jgi:hypothetical protein
LRAHGRKDASRQHHNRPTAQSHVYRLRKMLERKDQGLMQSQEEMSEGTLQQNVSQARKVKRSWVEMWT